MKMRLNDMEQKYSMWWAKLIKGRQILNYEKIVPFFLLFILVYIGSAFKPSGLKKTISTIVIDAGHGGNDPGSMSNGVKEKDITLSLSLAFGKKLQALLPDVKVIYTRNTDKFIPLWERAGIANKNAADLFISLHCNSHANTAILGTETFAMGLHKAEDNLEVAKRENEVLLLENDYQQRYEGFDPNSPESHIYFSLYQNAYMEQSIKLAAKVEHQISKGINRPSRGVKQAGFVVLWKTGMPSILVESGFISNTKDREYLNSAAGVEEMANAMATAVVEYKKSFETPVAPK
jgi:N-acetylmuramoyl-L-alanine amidase